MPGILILPNLLGDLSLDANLCFFFNGISQKKTSAWSSGCYIVTPGMSSTLKQFIPDGNNVVELYLGFEILNINQQ